MGFSSLISLQSLSPSHRNARETQIFVVAHFVCVGGQVRGASKKKTSRHITNIYHRQCPHYQTQAMVQTPGRHSSCESQAGSGVAEMILTEVRCTYGSFSRLWCHCRSSCRCRCTQGWEGCTAHCRRWTRWCCCSSWTGTRPRRCCPHNRRSNHSDSCTGRSAHCRKWRLLIGTCERLGEEKTLKGDVDWSNPSSDSTHLHTEVATQEHVLYHYSQGLASSTRQNFAPNSCTMTESSLPQTVSTSSLPSPQSLSLSHFQSGGMQRPLRQVNCDWLHRVPVSAMQCLPSLARYQLPSCGHWHSAPFGPGAERSEA